MTVVSVDVDGTLLKNVSSAFRKCGIRDSKVLAPVEELVFLCSKVAPIRASVHLLAPIIESLGRELDEDMVKSLIRLKMRDKNIDVVICTSNPRISKKDMEFVKGELGRRGLDVERVEFVPKERKGAGSDILVDDDTIEGISACRHGAEVVIANRRHNAFLGRFLSRVNTRISRSGSAELADTVERIIRKA
jgi:hypothetical protein